ncbi:glycosyl transferase, family 2 [Roseiflexus sp. RS-1]|jgi:glycosyltransferase involved in cell wall biosynthesis|nr:glycosyl transferase, family 2 [Roseiflexus sp. RS-1]
MKSSQTAVTHRMVVNRTEKAPTPRVSIGLPVYNGERYLASALESILAQTFGDFEVIISDNASTDATPEICRAYMARDPRIRYVRNERNLGAAPNYNRVFHLARGMYFRWHAHDDLLAPTYLEQCVAALDAHPGVVLCHSKTVFIDEHDRVIGYDEDSLHFRQASVFSRYYAYLRVARNWINAIFGLIRTDVLRQTVLIGAYSSSDMILLAELILRGEFYEVPEYLFLRRDHEEASVQANRDYQKRQVWFDPRNRGKIELTHWRWTIELLRVIGRVPLAWHDRLLCYAHMQWWLRRTRREMLNDLAVATRLVIHKATWAT